MKNYNKIIDNWLEDYCFPQIRNRWGIKHNESCVNDIVEYLFQKINYTDELVVEMIQPYPNLWVVSFSWIDEFNRIYARLEVIEECCG